MCRAKKRQQYNFITNYIIKERNNIFEVLKEKKKQSSQSRILLPEKISFKN